MLATGALALSAAATAQYPYPYPAPPPAPYPYPYPPVAQPWPAEPQQLPFPAPAPAPAAQPTPAAQHARQDKPMPIEPIDLPPAVEQGVDMIFIDQEIEPSMAQRESLMHGVALDDWSGAPVDLFLPVNPIYTELRRGLVRYQQRWGDLPQMTLPTGPALKPGSTDPRVSLLRQRLGLVPGTKFDERLTAVVKEYQAAHGLKVDGIVGNGMIASLNLGPQYYQRLAIVNMERAKRLPLDGERQRYVLVDAGAARLYMYENGRVVDSMKVIVGKAETATPMMAAQLRFASVNPYWNVPPELVKSLVAPRVVAQGVSYLTEREYQVLADWSDNPKVLDPTTIDWKAVADGRQEIRLRRLPSPANSMGMVKFMMPNAFGIYLHDTPEKFHFQEANRWISNGCIRVEDAKRLGDWLYGSMPKGRDPKVEEEVPLAHPVPVYVTYLTVAPTATGLEFRGDPYGRDAPVLARYFGSSAVASR